MEPIYIIAVLVLIAAETSYLTYEAVKPKTKKYKSSIVCDTSALIDGRIVSIARSGFLSAELIVPRSVVRELQYMADKADHDKRERARYGLDVIQTLQTVDGVSVTVFDDGETHADGVDEQLIVIAKKFNAKLCTTDYNLNKVARVESVTVVNVNELAHALRPMHLPGERVSIQIVQPGQGPEQGVGYLDDGTMVVVDKARKSMNEVIEVEAIRVLQTEAGRMLFARRVGEPQDSSQKRPDTRNNTRDNKEQKQPRRPFRKRTSEDNLVELANK